MRPSQVEIAQLDKFFSSINIPEVIKIDAATTFLDAPKYVEQNIQLLKDKQMSDLVASCRFEMLVALRKAILEPVR
jgi:hypothetical protein